MPTMTSHSPGTFCWVELASTDAEAAKKFYPELFGWTIREVPITGGVLGPENSDVAAGTVGDPLQPAASRSSGKMT